MCPACGRPMAILELRGVEIDHCLDCGGTWLDRGELERIAAAAGVTTPELVRAVGAPRMGPRGSRRCPRCRRRLRLFPVGRPDPVELDRCPRCAGLWFDRDEIEKVVGSFSEGHAGAVARFFADFFGRDLGSRHGNGSRTG
jgi:Zn-finger nucleic acid-binding protein